MVFLFPHVNANCHGTVFAGMEKWLTALAHGHLGRPALRAVQTAAHLLRNRGCIDCPAWDALADNVPVPDSAGEQGPVMATGLARRVLEPCTFATNSSVSLAAPPAAAGHGPPLDHLPWRCHTQRAPATSFRAKHGIRPQTISHSD